MKGLHVTKDRFAIVVFIGAVFSALAHFATALLDRAAYAFDYALDRLDRAVAIAFPANADILQTNTWISERAVQGPLFARVGSFEEHRQKRLSMRRSNAPLNAGLASSGLRLAC